MARNRSSTPIVQPTAHCRTLQLHAALPVLIVAALAACAKQEPAPDPLKAQRNAVQKAKGVNDVVGGAAEEQRKQIDEAETK